MIGFITWNSFIEEFGARAYPIEKLKNHINPHIIFTIMGLLFTVGHFMLNEFSIYYFLALFGISYIFSLLYFYSRSIWLVVGVHSGVNWVSFTFFGTNWEMGALYNIRISGITTWVYDFTEVIISLLILALIVLLNKIGFFRKYFPEKAQ